MRRCRLACGIPLHGVAFLSGFDTPSLQAQGRQRRSSYFNIPRDIPGKPQQNAYVERYNRTVWHEWPDPYILETIEDAQAIAADWLRTSNNESPNVGIGRFPHRQKLKTTARVLRSHLVEGDRITVDGARLINVSVDNNALPKMAANIPIPIPRGTDLPAQVGHPPSRVS